MEYYEKYIKYKNKYINLRDNNNILVGGKRKNKRIENSKCDIEETDKILFGDGGSTSIIVITKDKRVYKIFTLYDYIQDKKLEENIKLNNEGVMTEINIMKELTKNIIDKKISEHIVKYIGMNECKNAKLLFKKCPGSYVEFMKIEDEKKNKLCKTYYRSYPIKKINDEYKVVEVEYCDYSSGDFISDISRLGEIEMEKYLDIFFFQIIYTIVKIQEIYPNFIHNDLFMRNILGKREKDNNNYYEYKYNDKIYYVPQKKYYPKINDFGYTNLDEKNTHFKLQKSEYKDIYNIILDVYNGGNLGAKSLTELCKENPDKIKFLKMYFSNYFNVDVIDEFKKNSKEETDRNWNNILDDEYLKKIEMKNPTDLLNNYFYNIFNKINSKL